MRKDLAEQDAAELRQHSQFAITESCPGGEKNVLRGIVTERKGAYEKVERLRGPQVKDLGDQGIDLRRGENTLRDKFLRAMNRAQLT